MSNLTAFERHVLDCHLVDYPEGKSFKEVLGLLGSEEVEIWEKLEGWSVEDMREHLETLANFEVLI